MVGVAVEVLIVGEFRHSADEADKFLSVNPFNAVSASGMPKACGDKAEVEKEAHAIFVVFVLAGD